MAIPNNENGSPEETQQFLQELGRIIDFPPLPEEFHERLRENLKNISSGTVEPAQQEYEIQIPPSSARKAAASKAGKQSNWSKGVFFFEGVLAAVIVIVGAFLLAVLTNILPSSLSNYMSPFLTKKPSTQEAQNHISVASAQLQEIERKNNKVYEALVAVISTIHDRLEKSEGDISKELTTLAHLMESIVKDKPGDRQQHAPRLTEELPEISPDINDRVQQTSRTTYTDNPLTSVMSAAEVLQKRIADSLTITQSAHIRTTPEESAQILDEELAAIKTFYESLSENSNIWTELDRLLPVWEKQYTSALKRSETDPAFKIVADGWQARIKMANKLHRLLLTIRIEAWGLLQRIEKNRKDILIHAHSASDVEVEQHIQKTQERLVTLHQNIQTLVDIMKQMEVPTAVPEP